MSFILDSLTNNDRKRQEQRPLATLLPQGNRALKSNKKALALSILSGFALAMLLIALVWLIWTKPYKDEPTDNEITQNLTPDDELIRKLQLITSLERDENLTVESSSSLVDNSLIKVDGIEQPEIITQPKRQISTDELVVAQSELLTAKKEPNPVIANAPPPERKESKGVKPATEVAVLETQTTTSNEASVANEPVEKVQPDPNIPTSSPTNSVDNSTNSAISKTYPVDFKAPKLSALSFSNAPNKRFVMLDSVIYKEGDITLDDITVVEIQKDRIVLEKNGQRFFYQ